MTERMPVVKVQHASGRPDEVSGGEAICHRPGPELTPKNRQIEVDRYDVLYFERDFGKVHKVYEMSELRRQQAVEATCRWKGAGLLDIGCGRGEYLTLMEKRAKSAVKGPFTGVEPTDFNSGRKNVIQAMGHDIPVPDQSYDYVTCWDVIEHLIPGDEVNVFKEMRRIARKGIGMSICSTPDKHAGGTLHINLRPSSEWTRRLTAAFPDDAMIVFHGLHHGTPIWIITLA